MTKENRFEGLMGVVGKNKNAQTSKHTDVQKPNRRKKTSSKPDVETSKSLNIQTSKVQEHSDKLDISASKPRNDSDLKSESQAEVHSAHLNVQTSKKAKSANPDYTRTTMYLPKKMHKQLKAIALDEEKEMSSIVEELIDTWLNSRQ